MGGILGIWHRDGEPIDAAVLAGMSATLRHRGPDGERCAIAGSAGLVQQHLFVTPEESSQPLPLVSASGVSLVMEGRLDNRDELMSALALHSGASDAAFVMAAYDVWGDRLGERLNGDFAAAIVDRQKQRVVLLRDSVGLRPLYYYCDDRLLAFASEIKALLAHPRIPRAVCDEGLADFMLLGSRPVDRQDLTCFEGVSAVIPAHVVIVTPRQLTSRRYWDFDRGLTIRLGSFGEYAEAFREHFERAVRRRARTDRTVAISVSGGFDSSSVFCQFERLRSAPGSRIPRAVGVSYYGPPGSYADERRYLVEIEQQCGVAVERFAMEPLQGLVRGAYEEIHSIEAPFLDYMWGVTRELHCRAQAHGARTLLTGHWGDQVLFSAAYLADLFGTLRWPAIAQHLSQYREFFGDESVWIYARRSIVDVGRQYLPAALLPAGKWIRRRLVRPSRGKPWFTKDFLRMALRHADRPVDLGGEFHSAHARSIYLEARSKYHVHCLEWNNKVAAGHGMTVAFPFLDRDLVQFLMAVPGDVQNHRGVPRAMAREAMKGILPDSIRARKWKADFTAVGNGSVAHDAEEIQRALSPNALGVRSNYLDSRELSAAIVKLTTSTRDDSLDSWDVIDLFGLEVWLRTFFESAAPAAVAAP